MSSLVCGELAPKVVGLLLLRVLEVVLSVGARLPDVDNGIGNALLGVKVADYTVHKSLLTIRMFVTDDGVAELTVGGVR